MSMFANLTRSHRGPSREAIARRKAKQTAKIDGLAELVADGLSIAAASRILGLSESYGKALWGKVRADLGWQAR